MARLENSSRDIVEFAANGGAPDALFELGLGASQDVVYEAGRQKNFFPAVHSP